MSKHHAVKHARRVNKLVVEHKRAGRPIDAEYCAGIRCMWMTEARRAVE